MDIKPEIITAIILAIGAVLGWVRMRGMEAGKKSERKKAAGIGEILEERIHEAEAEAERNKPLADRLASMRERIKSRRGL